MIYRLSLFCQEYSRPNVPLVVVTLFEGVMCLVSDHHVTDADWKPKNPSLCSFSERQYKLQMNRVSGCRLVVCPNVPFIVCHYI
jgi:hypothetical protein